MKRRKREEAFILEETWFQIARPHGIFILLLLNNFTIGFKRPLAFISKDRLERVRLSSTIFLFISQLLSL